MQVEIRGAHQLADLSKRFKAAGEDGKGLRKEMLKSIQRSTKPLKADARRNTDRLPQSGGLGALIAKGKLQTKTRSGGKNVGVKIVAKGTAVKSTDKGTVRHRVFGRDVWVMQPVTPGWFTDAMEAGAPKVRREVLDAMNTVARKIARG